MKTLPVDVMVFVRGRRTKWRVENGWYVFIVKGPLSSNYTQFMRKRMSYMSYIDCREQNESVVLFIYEELSFRWMRPDFGIYIW